RYAHGTNNIADVKEFVRITGPFPYISGMATFVIANISLGFGMLIGGFQRRVQGLGWVGAALVTVSLAVGAMTGSRSVLVLPAVAILFLITRGLQLRLLQASVLFGLVVTIGLVAVLAQTRLAQGRDTLAYRLQTAHDTQDRFEEPYMDP